MWTPSLSYDSYRVLIVGVSKTTVQKALAFLRFGHVKAFGILVSINHHVEYGIRFRGL